jgi:hypothetical protein
MQASWHGSDMKVEFKTLEAACDYCCANDVSREAVFYRPATNDYFVEKTETEWQYPD